MQCRVQGEGGTLLPRGQPDHLLPLLCLASIFTGPGTAPARALAPPLGKSRSPEHERSKKEICSWPLGTPWRVLRPGEKLYFRDFLGIKMWGVLGGTGSGRHQAHLNEPEHFLPPTPSTPSTLHGLPFSITLGGGGYLVLKEARAEGATRARWVGSQEVPPLPSGKPILILTLPLWAKGVGQRSIRSRALAWHEGKFLCPR